MLSYNIKIALRLFKRFKAYSIINIAGLAIGILCIILIGVWVEDELSMDGFHNDDDRLYLVIAGIPVTNDITYTENTPGLLHQFASTEIASVEEGVRVTSPRTILFKNDEDRNVEKGRYVSANFLKVFNYPLLHGDPEKALNEQRSVIITENLARKYFDKTDVVGEQMSLVSMNIDESFLITGVLKSLPTNNTVKFDFLLSYDLFLDRYQWNKNWSNYNDPTYIKLAEGADVADVEKQLSNIIFENSESEGIECHLRLFKDHYLQSNLNKGLYAKGRIVYINIFLIIGGCILIVSIINYVNLTIARSTARLKEFGARKLYGANRPKLIGQLLTESFVAAFLSGLMALIILFLILPWFEVVTDKSALNPFSSEIFWLFVFLITLITGLLAGLYPSFYLSAIGIVDAFNKSKFKNKSFGGLRKVLLSTQFTVSITLIISSIIIYNQLDYVMSKELGIDKSSILRQSRVGSMIKNLDTYKNRLASIPGIKSVAGANMNPLEIGNTTSSIQWPGMMKDQEVNFHVIQVDKDIIKTFNMTLLAGNDFEQYADSANHYVILNQKAVEAMGLSDPIGVKITVWENEKKIVGVVKDFHHTSLENPIDPVIIYYNPTNVWEVFMKLEDDNLGNTLVQIEKAYQEIEPVYPFDYTFIEDEYDETYTNLDKFSSLTAVFAIVAVTISGLGLFALLSYTTAQRKKEIGIRKVLGAETKDLMKLFSIGILKLIIVSLVIGVAATYYLSNDWLNSFAFRIETSMLPYVFGVTVIFIIAIVTIGYNVMTAADENPSDTLRME